MSILVSPFQSQSSAPHSPPLLRQVGAWDWLARTGVSIGAAGACGAEAGDRRAAAFCREGEAGDLSFHERRATASGPV